MDEKLNTQSSPSHEDEYTVRFEHICKIPKHLLMTEYADLPEDFKKYLDRIRGLPCDGGGEPGRWCTRDILRRCKYYEEGDPF